MRHQIPVRIVVLRPLFGVSMMVQQGKDELLPAVAASPEELIFEFDLTVDMTETRPNFLGKFAQGPKDSRFVYVNSGTSANQDSIWSRRAKISLMDITGEQIEKVILLRGRVLQTKFEGVGRDGGPTCASVKGIVWKVVDN